MVHNSKIVGGNIKSVRLSIIIGCLMIVLSACSSQSPNSGDVKLGDDAYQEWVQQIKTKLADRPYFLPSYDPNVGPLELVYDINPASYSLELYRSDTYSIQKELSGPRTVHDLYYSYSRSDGKHHLNDSEISSRFNNLLEFQKGNNDIKIYELNGYHTNNERQEAIIDFLQKKGIKSARVLVVDLERDTNVEFHLIVDDDVVVISFTFHELAELDKYLAELTSQ
ncbi:hypothetical protein [Paenibacillus agri]|uniref:Uncharacterized protein n=1 Tax=Paenibacillus agri TaxID=2744309 RepID=A0A850EMM3_9BACL|nr:hypothetical protein [Paenibacillus agri]NUU59351.1 hypothetical protein [Paenibacillus agri]